MFGDNTIVTYAIREQDPLKQGLKQYCRGWVLCWIQIREQDPLKQGLKHLFGFINDFPFL